MIGRLTAPRRLNRRSHALAVLSITHTIHHRARPHQLRLRTPNARQIPTQNDSHHEFGSDPRRHSVPKRGSNKRVQNSPGVPHRVAETRPRAPRRPPARRARSLDAEWRRLENGRIHHSKRLFRHPQIALVVSQDTSRRS
jgi:hypothetical protein